ncbi:MAG: hypothetical protein R3352_01145 [Salinisphaeraceae bacterium]|nr:hypothetical protein [Salinisphaeraceae bacterium]
MACLTETQRQHLEEFRREKARKKLRVVRRQLFLLLALAGLTTSYYSMANDIGPCAEALNCPVVWTIQK